jgi:hypothetical protein
MEHKITKNKATKPNLKQILFLFTSPYSRLSEQANKTTVAIAEIPPKTITATNKKSALREMVILTSSKEL